MQFVWNGEGEREIWGVRFSPGVPTDAPEGLAAKLSRLAGFEAVEVKTRRRRKADDQDAA
jgi:hypothetical protein